MLEGTPCDVGEMLQLKHKVSELENKVWIIKQTYVIEREGKEVESSQLRLYLHFHGIHLGCKYTAGTKRV